MRMLVHVKFPHEPFNAAVRKGTIDKTMKGILDEIKPEAVYFTETDGLRSAIIIVDLPDPSYVPKIAEPWFLQFSADVKFHIVMSPEDLQQAGLDKLGEKWG